VTEFKELESQFISSIDIDEKHDVVTIDTTTGTYRLQHHQDCCEHVGIHIVLGSVEAVLNQKVVIAKESASELPPEEPEFETAREAEEYEPESETWSLFEIETENGGKLSILWHGESNGYYSEGVDFRKV